VIELCARFRRATEEFKEGLPYLGSGFQNRDEEEWGHVKAFDPATGREVWSWRGEAPDRHLAAVHGGRARVLGRAVGHVQRARRAHRRGAVAVPDGERDPLEPGDLRGARQAVRRGSRGWGGWLEGFAPKNYGVQRAVSLVVFALP
jgi:hypothetical protein